MAFSKISTLEKDFPEGCLYKAVGALQPVDYSSSISPRVDTRKTYLTLNLRGDIAVPFGADIAIDNCKSRPNTFGGNDILFGLSGILNLDIIAALKMGGGILADKNALQAKMWDDFLGLVAATPNRKNILGAFSEGLNGAPTPEKPYYFPQASYYQSGPGYSDIEQQRLYQCINGADANARHSFLNSDESYTYVRELVRAGKIIPLTLDIADNARVEELKTALGDEFRIAAVYTSNVFFYLKLPEDFNLQPNNPAISLERALQSVERLVGSDASVCVIDAGLKHPQGRQLQVYTLGDLRKAHVADISKLPPQPTLGTDVPPRF